MDAYYATFFRELQHSGVSYVLCGGLAIVLQGFRRFTADIDIIISLQIENVLRFVELVSRLGYRPRLPIPAVELADPEKRRFWREEKGAQVFTFCDPSSPYRQIDVFISEPIPFEELHAASILRCDSDFEIRVASIEHLLRMKRQIQPPRDHDTIDILMLERMLSDRR
ncbi:hypothetical protein A3D72_03375 [Candidatus Uhrbacteria bacterium RIFCSPHIGHO2_02_FULL_57_19]|uniref:Uncharacterized protein n=2 Tax=Parcubacteria group TaxID=1794811 RepID=A0A1F6CSI7_9BACT|nr:MAG: hypothetical protein A2704_02070 [Candidatus Kaiserbacteria bacterium RIFCSPHIGHO2_01_FULL_54_36b]OGL72508.1 MAG: hypothetical protein A3D72_03375 [Candidatus Uhrbacteria bacterium RIFCSPHIGHO2_02_FULL_57_19]